MDKSQIRNIRIQTLTNMALRGATMKELQNHAYRLASKKTADEYIDEVVRRLKSKS